ncbi:hypothetical protein THOA03_580002 [Vibrio owensii]|nr:hypothetical protein THOA03_580002 [Vibrio owensii]
MCNYVSIVCMLSRELVCGIYINVISEHVTLTWITNLQIRNNL